jgi:UDP-N-acetyl-D-galactosamine dehydrogenase
VPTPVNDKNIPDLSPLTSASKTIGGILKKGDIIVFESTVYPGVTEDICVPILEKESNLKLGEDFKVGYSPERINPGDKEHTIENIIKVVSGSDLEALDIIAKIYNSIVKAGVFKAHSIKTAEAAKVIENTQRDLNIALMNELSLIFKKLDLDTSSVLAAANTKWNFLDFKPGLVGGHCIGVDPYYLTFKSREHGYEPKVILAGRSINDSMAAFITNEINNTILNNKIIEPKVTILGLTFKEDCPDMRNSKVIDIVNNLKKLNIDIQICDPIASSSEIYDICMIENSELKELKPSNILVMAVAHEEFRAIKTEKLKDLVLTNGSIFDLKDFFKMDYLESLPLTHWKL